MDKVSIIDKIYTSIYISKAIIVCNNVEEMTNIGELLYAKSYPCGLLCDFQDPNVRLVICHVDEIDLIKSLHVDVIFFSDKDSLIKSFSDFASKHIIIVSL